MYRRSIPTLLVLLIAAGFASPVHAQDTIGIYVDFEGDLSSAAVTKPGVPFEIVVVAEMDAQSGAAEFVMTELMHLYSGVFKFWTTKINNTHLDLGDNQSGEYLMAFAGCMDAGVQELVRVQYYDVNGEIGSDVVLELSGLGPDASMPSSFDGGMGYASCGDSQGLRELAPAAWDDSLDIDPLRIPGVESTDGILVLNPSDDIVPTADQSVGLLKSRF